MRKTIHSQHSRAVGDALKRIREKADLTQRELCRVLGREHSFISKCELGERRVDMVEFYRICMACGANPETEVRKIVKSFVDLDRS